MDRHVEAFLEMLVAERGAAKNTLLAYSADLADFAASVRHVAAADGDDLRRYLSGLAGQGLSARTQARRLSSLRQFHLFLLREGVRADDPTKLLDAPKVGRSLPNIYQRPRSILCWKQPRPIARRADATRPWKFSTPPACGSANCWPCRARHWPVTPNC